MELWTSEAIIAAIHAKGITLRGLARKYHLAADAISATIHKPYEAGERAISTFLDVPASKLWPLRYNSDGTRRRPQPKSNYRPRRRFAEARRG